MLQYHTSIRPHLYVREESQSRDSEPTFPIIWSPLGDAL